MVGYHGRKKGLDADPTVMGSAVQLMAVNSTVPVFIMKDAIDRKDKKDGVFKFGACIDGSAKSMNIIEYINSMRGSTDVMEVIICPQANVFADKIQEEVTKKAEELNAKDYVSFKVLEAEEGISTSDLLSKYIMEESSYIDFVFVGNTGASLTAKDDHKYLGSTATKLVTNPKLNVFFMM